MKKSKQIRLLLMGSAMMALSGCFDDDEPAKLDVVQFDNMEQCQAYYTDEECHKAFEKAKPVFKSKDECEAWAGVGKCDQPQAVAGGGNTTIINNNSGGGGGGWTPFMEGYIIGQMVGGPHYYSGPVIIERTYVPVTTRPGAGTFNGRSYSSPSVSTRTYSASSNIGRSVSAARSSSSVSRGGFGASGAAHGGGGGSSGG